MRKDEIKEFIEKNKFFTHSGDVMSIEKVEELINIMTKDFANHLIEQDARFLQRQEIFLAAKVTEIR